jgi:formylmethanofuran dehydrogenase subunit E-like metal-binding protein
MDIKAIIGEVARRHNVRLAEDDPILATVTITEIIHRLFADHLKTLIADVSNQATDRLIAQIETARREISNETNLAKETASKLVNDAGDWSAEKMKQISSIATDDIRNAISANLAKMQADINIVRRARRIAVWSAIVTVCVGCIFFGGGIGFWMAGR